MVFLTEKARVSQSRRSLSSEIPSGIRITPLLMKLSFFTSRGDPASESEARIYGERSARHLVRLSPLFLSTSSVRRRASDLEIYTAPLKPFPDGRTATRPPFGAPLRPLESPRFIHHLKFRRYRKTLLPSSRSPSQPLSLIFSPISFRFGGSVI